MRKMTEQSAVEIRHAFAVLQETGIPEGALIDHLARHAIGLLEVSDDHPEWFEEDLGACCRGMEDVTPPAHVKNDFNCPTCGRLIVIKKEEMT